MGSSLLAGILLGYMALFLQVHRTALYSAVRQRRTDGGVVPQSFTKTFMRSASTPEATSGMRKLPAAKNYRLVASRHWVEKYLPHGWNLNALSNCLPGGLPAVFINAGYSWLIWWYRASRKLTGYVGD